MLLQEARDKQLSKLMSGEIEVKIMEDKDLAFSFGESFSEEVSDCLGELAEVGLDSIMEDGLLKEIPFFSTAISLYRIGKSIHERHHLVKLAAFLSEINKGAANETDRQKYREKFQGNEKFRNQELEFILIIIDRYLGFEKPKILAKLYLAYLQDNLSWDQFTIYAEVIDRFLPGDFNMLKSADSYRTERDIGTDSLQRLIALGLVIEEIRTSNIQYEEGTVIIDDPKTLEKKERHYVRTKFGNTLVDILEM